MKNKIDNLINNIIEDNYIPNMDDFNSLILEPQNPEDINSKLEELSVKVKLTYFYTELIKQKDRINTKVIDSIITGIGNEILENGTPLVLALFSAISFTKEQKEKMISILNFKEINVSFGQALVFNEGLTDNQKLEVIKKMDLEKQRNDNNSNFFQEILGHPSFKPSPEILEYVFNHTNHKKENEFGLTSLDTAIISGDKLTSYQWNKLFFDTDLTPKRKEMFDKIKEEGDPNQIELIENYYNIQEQKANSSFNKFISMTTTLKEKYFPKLAKITSVAKDILENGLISKISIDDISSKIKEKREKLKEEYKDKPISLQLGKIAQLGKDILTNGIFNELGNIKTLDGELTTIEKIAELKNFVSFDVYHNIQQIQFKLQDLKNIDKEQIYYSKNLKSFNNYLNIVLDKFYKKENVDFEELKTQLNQSNDILEKIISKAKEENETTNAFKI